MVEYRKVPPPPPSKRLLALTRHPVVAGIVATVVGGFLLYLIFGFPGSNSSSTTRPPAAQEASAEPVDALEKIEQRPYWITAPETFDAADAPTAWGVAAVQGYPLDLLVGRSKEMYESPEAFRGKTFYIVGRVVSQQTLAGPFYERELRLVSGERGYDVYVGMGRFSGGASDGDVAVVFGRLAAVGETHAPGLPPQKSVYMLSLYQNSAGGVESAILVSTTSGSLRKAIRHVTARTK